MQSGNMELIMDYLTRLLKQISDYEMEINAALTAFCTASEKGGDPVLSLKGKPVSQLQLAKNFWLLHFQNKAISQRAMMYPKQNEDEIRKALAQRLTVAKRLGIEHEDPPSIVAKWLTGK